MACETEQADGKQSDESELVNAGSETNIIYERTVQPVNPNPARENFSLIQLDEKAESANDLRRMAEGGDVKIKIETTDTRGLLQCPAASGDSMKPSSSFDNLKEHVEASVFEQLGEVKRRIEQCKDIPEILLDVPLQCLHESTLETLSYHLDIESDILTPDHKLKDYRGMAEWVGLEVVFIRYVSAQAKSKTKDIISKWMTLDGEPRPTLRNLRLCLLEMDRPDVLEDMSIIISKNAWDWKKTQIEANSVKPSKPAEDTSWQLTRHDVVSKKKTMYTACLLYADEDELMANLIIDLYRQAYKHARFFIPQFDLKTGKWELDTTARIIDERCDKKVVFLLSEYFYASTICQFAVNYVAAHGTGQGNLVPFHLSRNVTSIPNVLKGISGIRWFRKATRKHSWDILTESLLANKTETCELLNEIKEKIKKLVEKEPETYLQDPPYAEDMHPPGKPLPVVEPPESSSSSSCMPITDYPEENSRQILRDNNDKMSKKKWNLFGTVKKTIYEKVFKQPFPKKSSSDDKMTPMEILTKFRSEELSSSGQEPNISSEGVKQNNESENHCIERKGTSDKTSSENLCADKSSLSERQSSELYLDENPSTDDASGDTLDAANENGDQVCQIQTGDEKRSSCDCNTDENEKGNNGQRKEHEKHTNDEPKGTNQTSLKDEENSMCNVSNELHGSTVSEDAHMDTQGRAINDLNLENNTPIQINISWNIASSESGSMFKETDNAKDNKGFSDEEAQETDAFLP